MTAEKQEYRRALRKLGKLGDENNGFLAFKIAKNGKINFQNQALDGT